MGFFQSVEGSVICNLQKKSRFLVIRIPKYIMDHRPFFNFVSREPLMGLILTQLKNIFIYIRCNKIPHWSVRLGPNPYTPLYDKLQIGCLSRDFNCRCCLMLLDCCLDLLSSFVSIMVFSGLCSRWCYWLCFAWGDLGRSSKPHYTTRHLWWPVLPNSIYKRITLCLVCAVHLIAYFSPLLSS